MDMFILGSFGIDITDDDLSHDDDDCREWTGGTNEVTIGIRKLKRIDP